MILSDTRDPEEVTQSIIGKEEKGPTAWRIPFKKEEKVSSRMMEKKREQCLEGFPNGAAKTRK